MTRVINRHSARRALATATLLLAATGAALVSPAAASEAPDTARQTQQTRQADQGQRGHVQHESKQDLGWQ
ncbi:hypothetical protein [Streptomyces sp. NPDC089799]|uniref:hypothetical protein n=1 Tax=Streptomyces sp. NPDC089799 TaxID=3155066 RepID=UPI00343FBCB7